MTDGRTPEQVAADDALTQAIKDVWTAYYGEPAGYVFTEYVVLGAARLWGEDGEPQTASFMMPRDGDVPLHQLLGLAAYATTRWNKRISEDHDR